ncbi:exosome complex component RRP46 [Leptopilina heterotoma]|uniref:exosome complex component RRP46 n=1 Tax=Leptopilina heterotoma TaxID=63436 RepID=UPI001CA9E525|nr:exosome complex component RRP46 [Leptopilina heterotoma]
MTETEFCLRPMKCELNVLSVPDGSSMFMQGDTSIISAVYGPVEAKVQKMLYDKAHVEVTYNAAKGPPSVNGRVMEKYIKDSCESAIMTTLHPGASVSINVQELQDSGGILACALNASCLALINASVSMKYTVAAVHCMIDKDSDQIIVDPDNVQIQNSRASFTYAFDSVRKDVICCHTTGTFLEKDLIATKKCCKNACQYIFDFYREIVKKYANII